MPPLACLKILFSEAKFEHTTGEKYCLSQKDFRLDFVLFLMVLWLGFVILLALPPLACVWYRQKAKIANVVFARNLFQFNRAWVWDIIVQYLRVKISSPKKTVMIVIPGLYRIQRLKLQTFFCYLFRHRPFQALRKRPPSACAIFSCHIEIFRPMRDHDTWCVSLFLVSKNHFPLSLVSIDCNCHSLQNHLAKANHIVMFICIIQDMHHTSLQLWSMPTHNCH